MKRRIRKLTVLIVYLIAFDSFASAQKHPAEAEKDPLSTVMYLLSTTDKDDDEDRDQEKACLVASLADVNRQRDIEGTLQTLERGSHVDATYVNILDGMVSTGKVDNASRLFSILVQRFSDDEYLLPKLSRSAIKLGRTAELVSAIEKFGDSDKLDLLLALAQAYADENKTDEAIEILRGATPLAEKSEHKEDKAEVALHFARLKQPEPALRLAQLAMTGLEWQNGKPEYTEGRVIDRVIDTYRLTGQNKQADEMLVRQGNAVQLLEAPSQVEIARQQIRNGNRKAGLKLLAEAQASLRPADPEAKFRLGEIFDLYLALGDSKRADRLARSLSSGEARRQEKLLLLAEHYARTRDRSKAFEVLEFALAMADKIDISEPEDGRLWTSKKWDQANYQAAIAERLTDMRFDREAISVISRLTKPYLKASSLRRYVEVNQSRLPAEKLAPLLEQSLALLRQEKTDIFDSRLFDVFGAVGRGFAQLGMPNRANEVFAEALTLADRLALDTMTDTSLLFVMCSLGVDFERSKIEADENVKAALRKIIQHWENDEY